MYEWSWLSPFPPDPPAAGVWPGRCASPSGRTSPGLWCSSAPGSLRHGAAVSRPGGGSSLRGTTFGPPAPPELSARPRASAEDWSYPRTPLYAVLRLEEPEPESGS